MRGEVVLMQSTCNHLTPLHVWSGGELVAWLCPDCDEQFEPNYFKEVKISE